MPTIHEKFLIGISFLATFFVFLAFNTNDFDWKWIMLPFALAHMFIWIGRILNYEEY